MFRYTNPGIGFLDNRYLKLDASNDPVTGPLVVDVNSTEAFKVEQSGVKDDILIVDTTNGRVGVGTATPVSLLEISNSSINMDGGQTLDVGLTAKASLQALNVSGDILTFFGNNAFADGTLAAQRFDTSKLAWFFVFDNRVGQDLFKLERLDSSGVVNRPFMVLNDGSFGFGNFTSIPAFTGAKFYQDAAGDIFIGNGAENKDYKITFKGENNEGILTWMEDEDRFEFADTTRVGDGTNYAEIDNTGNLLFAGGGGVAYGEIYANDNAATTSVSSAGFTQVLIFDTDGASNNMTPDHTNDHITITKAGHYMVNVCTTVVNNAGSGHVIEMVVAKNDNAVIFGNCRRHRTLASGTDKGALPICGHIDLAVDDTIEVWVSSDSGAAKNITIEDITLGLTMVGGT